MHCRFVLALVCLLSVTHAVEFRANPMRKIISMLQDMQKELEREGSLEKDTFEKAMCACDSTLKQTQNTIADATAEVSEQSSLVDSSTAEQASLNQEISEHQASKDAAENDLSEATNIRQKQASTFVREEKETKISIRQLSHAIPALEKGMTAASLMQLRGGPRLRRLIEVTHYLSSEDRAGVLAFLDAGSDDEDSVSDTQQSPSSSEIVGMLKNMKDEMTKDLADMRATANANANSFSEMSAAKKQEIAVAQKAIVTKDKRIGALALAISEGKHALQDAQEELDAANKFLADTKDECEGKKKDRDFRAKMRTEEILAISDAVKMLNDDDALEGFAKTKPSAAFIQPREKAVPVQTYDAFIQLSSSVALKHKHRREAIAAGPVAGAAEKLVSGMIEGMVAVLHDEDVGDEHKKEWCTNETQINSNLLQGKKDLIDKLTSAIADQEDQSATLADKIKALEDKIGALDKMVHEETELRKKEHQEFVDSFATMSTSVRLINKAIKRLERFYAPEKSAADRKAVADAAFKREGLALLHRRTQQRTEAAVLQQEAKLMPGGFDTDSFLQVSSQVRSKQKVKAKANLRETSGAYEKKEGGGVIGLLYDFMGDVKTDMAEAETEEKYSAKDYTRIMHEAQSTRDSDVKAMNQKNSAKADLDEKLVNNKAVKEQSVEEQHNLEMFMAQLEGECGFLLRNFEVRHDGRIDEEVGLESAKSIVTHDTPPSHQEVKEQYAEEHTDEDVDDNFPGTPVAPPS